jgi:hypothetical protein
VAQAKGAVAHPRKGREREREKAEGGKMVICKKKIKERN